MNVKNIFLIALLLVVLATLGGVNASQDNVTDDCLAVSNEAVVGEVSQTDEDVLSDFKTEDSLKKYDEGELTSGGSFVDVSEAYALLNDFRRESGVWYWNNDDTTKTSFNTNSSNQLKTLTRDADLEKTAQIRAKEIVELFSHTRPDGSSCFTVYPDDLMAGGENIAYGQRSCLEVTDAWKETNDPYSGQGHRRNMLSENFNCVGIAGFKVNGITYWVQAFGYRDSPNTNYNTAKNPSSSKATPTLKASGKITFKAKSKNKKYTVTLKSGKKLIKKVQITLKIGKKTLKAKTNAKGKATFSIKLTKKGKYNGIITFKGNGSYNKVTKKVKITIR